MTGVDYEKVVERVRLCFAIYRLGCVIVGVYGIIEVFVNEEIVSRSMFDILGIEFVFQIIFR